MIQAARSLQPNQLKLSRNKLGALHADVEKTAAAIKLIYINDKEQGIIRVKKGDSFTYLKNNRAVKNKEDLARIKALVIPPAWENVWISPIANSHLQATGYDVRLSDAMAAKHGFKKVSKLKLAVSKKIRDFVAGGGYLFAMCSATDSYDIALAAENTDICDVPFDGDPPAADAQQRLDFSQCFAFKDFQLFTNPYIYEFSNIDNTQFRRVNKDADYFTLFTFSAKFDPVPSMLCQDHTSTIKGFMGQTTSFRKEVLKSNVLIMGDYKPANEARYIHGEFGKGTWTFYGGHDPEDYEHAIGDPPTDLSLHPNSPGYRLILNNVLFPAARKKPRKT